MGMSNDIRPEYDIEMIGKRLRLFRKKAGLSVKTVCGDVKIGTVQALYKVERGEGLPQTDVFLSLLVKYRIENVTVLYEK